jgi:hypothetical protein
MQTEFVFRLLKMLTDDILVRISDENRHVSLESNAPIS